MRRSRSTARTIGWVGALVVAFFVGRGALPSPLVEAQSGGRVFEIRIYTVEEGKVEQLSEVFRNNVTTMFAEHGMTNVAYFTPQEDPQCVTASPTSTILSPAFDARPCTWSKDTLVYILAHESRDAAAVNWDSFRNDADGLASFRQAYDRAGVKVMKIESAFMTATDYSALR